MKIIFAVDIGRSESNIIRVSIMAHNYGNALSLLRWYMRFHPYYRIKAAKLV